MATQTFQEQIAILTAFPAALRAQVHGLSSAALLFRPAPSEWSITEVIGHLIDIDVLQRGRIGKVISVENPTFEPFDIDGTVRAKDYQNKQANMLLHSFAEHRAEFLEQIRYLRPEALARTGQHPTRGPLSAAAIVTTLVGHDDTHTQQIANNLKAFRNQ
jgi:hypothetical protein